MERMIFRCRACGLELTEPLAPLPGLDLLSEADGTDYLPPGFYFLAPAPEEDGGYYTDAEGQFCINPREARNHTPPPGSQTPERLLWTGWV